MKPLWVSYSRTGSLHYVLESMSTKNPNDVANSPKVADRGAKRKTGLFRLAKLISQGPLAPQHFGIVVSRLHEIERLVFEQ